MTVPMAQPLSNTAFSARALSTESWSDFDDAADQMMLAFAVGDEEYGIPILAVEEVLQRAAVTPVPNVPDHFSGFTNVRGMIVPVVDLRVRFGRPRVDYGLHSVVILVKVDELRVGLLADHVPEVIRGQAETGLDRIPSRDGTAFVTGLVKLGSHIVGVLDLARVVGTVPRSAP